MMHGDDQVEQEGHFPLANAAMHADTSQTEGPYGNSTVEQYGSLPNPQTSASLVDQDEDWGEVVDARPILPKAAFFMGDLRDGLPMVSDTVILLYDAYVDYR